MFSEGGVMRKTLLALVFAAVPGIAIAQPPATGTIHTFYDPVFTGTVFCDTLEQVREIATAETPSDVYLNYLQTANARNEPTCATIIPTGEVVKVMPLGVMKEDGQHFHAWAVEAKVGSVTAFGLYLEHFEMVIA
jgi:hypothetical protein